MPTTIQLLLASRRNIGPPESPWQVSTRLPPAQIISLLIKLGYGERQAASVTNGTVALRRKRCWLPPSLVVPQPAIVKLPSWWRVLLVIGRVGSRAGRGSLINAQSLPAPVPENPGATCT